MRSPTPVLVMNTRPVARTFPDRWNPHDAAPHTAWRRFADPMRSARGATRGRLRPGRRYSPPRIVKRPLSLRPNTSGEYVSSTCAGATTVTVTRTTSPLEALDGRS